MDFPSKISSFSSYSILVVDDHNDNEHVLIFVHVIYDALCNFYLFFSSRMLIFTGIKTGLMATRSFFGINGLICK